MTKVCRLCLTCLHRGSKYYNINAVESFTGFMPYRDQLTTCIPEMALDLIPDPVICNSCRNALKTSYDFKSRCLLVEKKIRDYVEKQSVDTLVYNLGDIKYFHQKTETDAESSEYSEVEIKKEINEKSETRSTSILSDLLSIRNEVILPSNLEIKITKKCDPSLSKCEIDERILGEQQKSFDDEVSLTPNEKDELGMYICRHCGRKFPNIPSLQTHKTRMHEEDYICNFCSVPFKTLQNLRKHNQMCQKAKSFPSAPSQTALTKRPHLPIKAKNHLKRWLFNHTDHPYPTDVEKQQLMKETNLSLLQVENWFINARRRILADLTRLKNMRGGLFRGRHLSRARGRPRGNIDGGGAVDDDFEMDAADTIAAWRQFKDFEAVESESNFLDFQADFEGEDPLERTATDQEIPDEELNERITVREFKEEGSSNEAHEINVDDLNVLPPEVKLEIDIGER